jgi:hypothetical protein
MPSIKKRSQKCNDDKDHLAKKLNLSDYIDDEAVEDNTPEEELLNDSEEQDFKTSLPKLSPQTNQNKPSMDTNIVTPAKVLNIVTPAKAVKHENENSEDDDDYPILSPLLKTSAIETKPTSFIEIKLEPRINRKGQTCYPNRIFAARTKSHDLVLWDHLPKSMDRSPTDFWMKRLNNHEKRDELANKLKFHLLSQRVSIDDPSTPLSNGRPGGHPWLCLLRLRKAPLSPVLQSKWCTTIAETATHIDCAGIYDNYYGYAGDQTPPTLQPLSNYITIQGVLEVLQQKFYNKTLHQIIDDNEITNDYFSPQALEIAKKQLGSYTKTSNTDSFLHEFKFD